MDDLRFFCDRSLGDHVVPESLRRAGWEVVSMRERYGSVTAQQLADIDWIRDATQLGEVLLTGDKAIAKRPVEARAVATAAARVFALGSSELTGPQKASHLMDNRDAISRRARMRMGPYVVSVTGHGLQTVKLFV